MRLVVIHSPHDHCGVGQYGRQLDRSLARVPDVSVVAGTYASLATMIASDEIGAGDVVLFHYEPQLAGEWSVFASQLAVIRRRGGKIVFCCHWYDPWVPYEYAEKVDLFVLHRYYDFTVEEYAAQANKTTGLGRAIEIPLACPVYEPSASRAELRARLGLPAAGEATVVTTVGFLTSWKRMPEVVERVLGELQQGSFVHVQAPYPFEVAASGAMQDEQRLREIVGRFPGRARFSTEFLPEKDLLDLAHASDLGFVFHGKDTGSASAATKSFVSARTPVVITASSHASDLVLGVERVAGFDLGEFARQVARIASDPVERQRLGQAAAQEYGRINMDVVARRYVEELSQL